MSMYAVSLVSLVVVCFSALLVVSAWGMEAATSTRSTSNDHDNFFAAGGVLLSPANESQLYHGNPTLLRVPNMTGGAAMLVAAWEGSRTSSESGQLRQRVYLSFSTEADAGSSWTYPIEVIGASLNTPMWAPALFYDITFSTLYLYYTLGAGTPSAGQLVVTSTTDWGRTWSTHEPIMGLEGFVSGSVVPLAASVDVQTLPTWAMTVETPNGIVVLRALSNSSKFQTSTVVMSSNYTAPKFVPYPNVLDESDESGTYMVVAQVNDATRTDLPTGSVQPLVYSTCAAKTLMYGWSTAMTLPMLSSPLGRSFAAAKPALVSASVSTWVAYATFESNETSAPLEISFVDLGSKIPEAPRAAVSLNTTNVNATFVIPAHPTDLIARSLDLIALNASNVVANNTGNSLSSSDGMLLLAYWYDGQLFTIRKAVTLPGSSAASSPEKPNAAIAIAITVSVVFGVCLILVIVYVRGRLQTKTLEGDEAYTFMRPEDEGTTSQNIPSTTYGASQL